MTTKKTTFHSDWALLLVLFALGVLLGAMLGHGGCEDRPPEGEIYNGSDLVEVNMAIANKKLAEVVERLRETQNCWNCLWAEKTDESTGRCRRFPPILGDFSAISYFDWCGEWKPRTGAGGAKQVKRAETARKAAADAMMGDNAC